VCVPDREGAVRLGRYMIRCPIVLERLAWDGGAGQVVCHSRPTRRSGPLPAEARWHVLEFLARVIDHIPEPSQQTVRYWGYYSNAARGKRRKAALTGDTTPVSGRQDHDEFT
jgi:Putative transposase